MFQAGAFAGRLAETAGFLQGNPAPGKKNRAAAWSSKPGNQNN